MVSDSVALLFYWFNQNSFIFFFLVVACTKQHS